MVPLIRVIAGQDQVERSIFRRVRWPESELFARMGAFPLRTRVVAEVELVSAAERRPIPLTARFKRTVAPVTTDLQPRMMPAVLREQFTCRLPKEPLSLSPM